MMLIHVFIGQLVWSRRLKKGKNLCHCVFENISVCTYMHTCVQSIVNLCSMSEVEELYKNCKDLEDSINPIREVNRRYQQVLK